MKCLIDKFLITTITKIDFINHSEIDGAEPWAIQGLINIKINLSL